MGAPGRSARRVGACLGISALMLAVPIGAASASVVTEHAHGTALAATTIFITGGGFLIGTLVTTPANCSLTPGKQYLVLSFTGNGVGHANFKTGPGRLIAGTFSGVGDVVPLTLFTTTTFSALSTPTRLANAKTVLASITVASGRMTMMTHFFISDKLPGHETINSTFNVDFSGADGTAPLKITEHGQYTVINATSTNPTVGTRLSTSFSLTCSG
jgi:hypothetical protein